MVIAQPKINLKKVIINRDTPVNLEQGGLIKAAKRIFFKSFKIFNNQLGCPSWDGCAIFSSSNVIVIQSKSRELYNPKTGKFTNGKWSFSVVKKFANYVQEIAKFNNFTICVGEFITEKEYNFKKPAIPENTGIIHAKNLKSALGPLFGQIPNNLRTSLAK